jgi:hypothetical protein
MSSLKLQGRITQLNGIPGTQHPGNARRDTLPVHITAVPGFQVQYVDGGAADLDAGMVTRDLSVRDYDVVVLSPPDVQPRHGYGMALDLPTGQCDLQHIMASHQVAFLRKSVACYDGEQQSATAISKTGTPAAERNCDQRQQAG